MKSVPPPHATLHRPRLSKFRKILIAITAATHVSFVVAAYDVARSWVGLDFVGAWLCAIALGALGVWVFNNRAEKIAEDAPRSFKEVLFFDTPFYIHWSACIYCAIPAIVYCVGSPIVDFFRGTPFTISPRFFTWTYATGLLVCGYGVTIRRWWFVTREVEIPIRGLDPKFDGYRLIHLSDLHVGALTPPWWVRRWIDRANELAGDAVVVTGDLVTSGVAFHQDIADLVGALRGKDGVYLSMGNHDYFGDGEPMISLIRDKGTNVLRNEGVVLEREDARLFITAIDDTWTRRADLDLALKERPEDVPTIMLAHDPDRFPQIAERGVDLVLSGHTHGGQIAMPFLARYINASKLAHHFHIGIYKQGASTLYVHPGLGTTGPPIRLGVAPTIAVHTLRAV